jgi:mannose-6-phosphate isomerase-like protein (cupin superfamily)
MSRQRRLVTGVDGAGRSVVVSDGPAPRTHDFTHIPAMGTTLMWATVRDDGRSHAGADPTPALTRDLPAPGETRFLLVTFPPDAVYAAPGFDAVAAQEETRRVSPDLATRFEPDAPGMHTTDTLDYVIVLDGDIRLELDDGVTVPLSTGDVVVQCAGRHAWRNPAPTPVTLAVVQLGPPPSPRRETP